MTDNNELLISLTPSEQSLIQQAQEAARSGYPGCYRTSNIEAEVTIAGNETDWEIGGDAELKTDWPPVNPTAPCTEYVKSPEIVHE